MVGKVKQRDITDCGAACLASVAVHYGLKIPVAKIRQFASTDKKGTNVLGMVEAANKMGFSAKGVRGEWDSLFKIPKPSIAHVIVREHLHHFVVIAGVSDKFIEIMDPGDGEIHKVKHEVFKKEWTGVLVLLIPSQEFQEMDITESTKSRFWKLLSPHKGILFQALIGAVLFAVLGLASAVYIGKIVDNVLPDGNLNLLNLLGVAMFTLITFRIILNVFQMQFVLKTGQKIDTTLILGYYQHILKLPQSFFDNMRVGEIISRINDAVKIRVFINDIAINLVVSVLILIVSFALMFTYYWKLALIMLVVVPLYVIVYYISNALNKKVQRKIMERAADLESQLVESLNSVATIKRFSLEWFSNLRTEMRFTSLLGEVYKSGLNSIFSSNSSSFLTQGFTVVLLWTGASFALKNQISPGELLSFYALLGYFTGPVSNIISFNRSFQDAIIASDRLFEIFDLEREDNPEAIELNEKHIGDIQFRDIDFRYGTRVQVFESLNMTIPVRQITAIVGESGSGKTTLASIMQNIYPLQRGGVYLGNYNIKAFTNNSLRKLIAIVPQRIDLFAGNVIENIAVGEFQPDMEKVMEVCNQLGITSFIEQLPGGFQSYLGENGVSLSGGQRQRIAIARALYQDPEILILDEATSSLDTIAEEFLYKTISLLRDSGKTIIIIAHRLSTIYHSDWVIVLDNGSAVQEGRPDELKKLDGKFRDIFVNHF